MITDVMKVVGFVMDEEKWTNVSETDARFVLERFHHFETHLDKLFELQDGPGPISDCKTFLTREMSSLQHESLQTKALAGASAAIEEAKGIVGLLDGNCSTPDKKHLQSWSDFSFTADFQAALGVLNSVSGRSLLHIQVQFLYMFATFLKDAAALSLARSAGKERKDRKVNEHWAKKVVSLRQSSAVVKAFMSTEKVKKEGILFPDPAQSRIDAMLSAAPRQSLNVKLDCTAVPDTIKAAEAVINSIITDWEEDTDNFYKLIDAWTPVAWSERKEDLLSLQHRGTFFEVLNNNIYIYIYIYIYTQHKT